MRRPQENPKTKQKLLDAAEDLMLKKGYAATSVDDICQAVHVTKGSFFHYFKSKDALGKVVLERFCCQQKEKMQETCCSDNREQDPLKRVYSYVDCVIKMSKDPNSKGCLVGTFAQELSLTHPHMRLLCEQSFSTWSKIFKENLKEAKSRYVPKADFDVQSLSEHFLAVFEGAQVLARAKKDKKVIEKSMQHFKRYLKSLFKQ